MCPRSTIYVSSCMCPLCVLILLYTTLYVSSCYQIRRQQATCQPVQGTKTNLVFCMQDPSTPWISSMRTHIYSRMRTHI